MLLNVNYFKLKSFKCTMRKYVVKKTGCIKWYVKSKPKIVRQGAILHTLVNRLLFTPTYDHLFFD